MEYTRPRNIIQLWLCTVLSVVVFAMATVVPGQTRAEAYLPIYNDATSADILLLENEFAFRFLPDIDGDGRPETLTVENGPGCRTSVIHRSAYRSDGALSTSDAAGQWRLFDSVDGCNLSGRTDVIGDVNGDGRRDLLYAFHDFDSGIDKTGLVFTPASSGDIDIAGLDGSSGFVLEHQFIQDAGDVNGDGFDDIIVDAHHVIAGATGYSARYSGDSLPDGLLVDSSLGGDGFTRLGDLNGDGYDDLLLGHINTLNAYAIVYGAAGLSRTIGEFDDLDSDGGAFMQQCAYSFGCSILPVGDVDGDGFDDLVVSFFGCGYANEAAVLYGSPEGVSLRDSLEDYLPGEITRITDSVSGGCLSGHLSGSVGDIDADGNLGYRHFRARRYGEYSGAVRPHWRSSGLGVGRRA